MGAGSSFMASKDDIIFHQLKRNKELEAELERVRKENETLKISLHEFEEKSIKGLEEYREWCASLDAEKANLLKRISELESGKAVGNEEEVVLECASPIPPALPLDLNTAKIEFPVAI
jgi:vacuolar-type H+-ATPase subunit I/STV1